MANSSIFAAFERMWQHIVVALAGKAEALHTHEISNINNLQITIDQIDETLSQKTQVQMITWGADD